MDKERFAVIIAGLSANFGGGATDILIETWWRMMEKDGITADQFAAAAEDVIRTRKYKSMPTYAEIVEFCKGTPDDQAAIQADEVLEMVRLCGASGNPIFDDPVTKYLMSRIWPWSGFCGSLLEKNIPFFKKDFIEAYKTYSKDFKRKEIEQIECGPELRQLIGGIG